MLPERGDRQAPGSVPKPSRLLRQAEHSTTEEPVTKPVGERTDAKRLLPAIGRRSLDLEQEHLAILVFQDEVNLQPIAVTEVVERTPPPTNPAA